MASATPKRDKHIRLMICLAKSCTEVAKALVLHYFPLAKPRDIEEHEWNLDDYLNENRDNGFLSKFIKDKHKKNILFPGHSKYTNIDHWDLATLFTVLGLFPNVDQDIIADMSHMKKLRNKLFHWGSAEMTDSSFDINKIKVEQFVDNCCRVIGNESIKDEVKVILEDMEENENIAKSIQTELEIWKKDDILDTLDKREPVIVSTLDDLFKKVADIFEIEVQQMPVINLTLDVKSCSKDISSSVTDMIYQNIRSPPPECEPKQRELRDAIDEVKQKFLSKERELIETCKACVILTVQCPNFNSLKSLLEECLTGQLTAAWKSVENILRHLYENDELTLELTITQSDFWCCIEELVEKITTSVYEQVGVDISPHFLPEIIMHPPTVQRDGKGSETGVSAVPITIKPKSYRHALEVSDVIKSGSLDEDFRKISTLLEDIYDMNDVTIAANVETTETGLLESETIYTGQCTIVGKHVEKPMSPIQILKRTTELINAKKEKEMYKADVETRAGSFCNDKPYIKTLEALELQA